MTVWMHKGGDILLRYEQQYHDGYYDVENYYGFMTDTYSKFFFKEHCVYIGRL